MTAPGNDNVLFDFDLEAVAAQIRHQRSVPLPTQADASRTAGGQATAAGLLPDTLTDRAFGFGRRDRFGVIGSRGLHPLCG